METWSVNGKILYEDKEPVKIPGGKYGIIEVEYQKILRPQKMNYTNLKLHPKVRQCQSNGNSNLLSSAMLRYSTL